MLTPEQAETTGLEEYAEKFAARVERAEVANTTAAEARALALQGIAELSRGVDIAAGEIRAGKFMQARETLALAKVGALVAEAAVQAIRFPESDQ